MHSIGGKQVEVKPATPRGSGPVGMPMAARYPGPVPGGGMGRGFGEMVPMGAGFPGGAYAGMLPFGPGSRMQAMVRKTAQPDTRYCCIISAGRSRGACML